MKTKYLTKQTLIDLMALQVSWGLPFKAKEVPVLTALVRAPHDEYFPVLFVDECKDHDDQRDYHYICMIVLNNNKVPLTTGFDCPKAYYEGLPEHDFSLRWDLKTEKREEGLYVSLTVTKEPNRVRDLGALFKQLMERN